MQGWKQLESQENKDFLHSTTKTQGRILPSRLWGERSTAKNLISDNKPTDL